MSDKRLSDRAIAFLAWMKDTGTNTRQVSITAQVPYTTLAAFVQGDTQNLRGGTEAKIGEAYGVEPSTIFGGGEAQGIRPPLVPIVGRVGADSGGLVTLARQNQASDMAASAPGLSISAVALEVAGHALHTFAEDGALIYFEDQKAEPDADMLGYPCVVETEEGRVMVKRLLRGSSPGLFDLESIVGPRLDDVRLNWAAEILAIVPPRQARRIIVRRGEEAAA